MKTRLDEVLNEEERLDLWCEIQVLANAMLEFSDWWWHLDPGLSACTNRRAGVIDIEDESSPSKDL